MINFKGRSRIQFLLFKFFIVTIVSLFFFSFQIRVRLFNAGIGDGLTAREETIPHVGALRGDRSVAGERAGHIPKSQCKVP